MIMSREPLRTRIRARLLRLFAAERGNVVITFALAIIPVIGFVGAAVDYSRANSAKAAMQAAADSTALMLSKDALGQSDVQLQQKAAAYFKALMNRTEVFGVAVTPTLSTPSQGNFRIDLTARGSVATSFWKVIGTDRLDIEVRSQVLWGMKRLELALALDNTGSMAWGGKIVELKKAVNSLLDTLQKAARRPDDIRVAIIPFDTTVRVDQTGKTAAPWVVFESQQERNTWIGCLEDRDQPHDTLDTPPTSASTYYPAEPCSNNGALVTMRPLTNDWDALRRTVLGMNPNGNTNVTIGLVWAWHALTANLPLSEASAPRPDLDKVIILLTDGQNTRNRWTSVSSAIDSRTRTTCANIKAANIKIYTVRVIDGNVELLRGCATNSSMYYDVQQASQLNSVFSAIAQNLANLRIAQ
jgi:Flp pilus assembly protein TadG